MGVEPSAVEISVRVVDQNSGEVIGNVTRNMAALGGAGSTTGAKVEQSMRGVAGAASAANAQVAAMQARMKAFNEEMMGLSAQGRKIFNEQLPALLKQGLAPMDAQAAALRQTTALLEQNAAAAAGMKFGYGEARMAMGALSGSGRMMEMGLANIGAKLSWMAPLWNAALPVAIGIGMVGMIVQMGEGVYDLYEKWLDVDGAIEKYNDKAAAAASKKFFDNAGIDELTSGVKAAGDQIDQLNQKRAKSLGWGQLLLLGAGASDDAAVQATFNSGIKGHFGMGDAATLNEAQGNSDQERQKSLEEIHKRNLQQIQDRALITEAGLTGIAKERAAEAAAYKEAAENRQYLIDQQRLEHEITSRPQSAKPGDAGYTSPVAAPGPSSHEAEYDQATARARAEFQAKEIEAGVQKTKEANDEIRRLDAEAAEAGLTGFRLLQQQKAEAIADFLRKYGDNANAMADIDHIYAEKAKTQIAEQQKQWDDMADRTLEEYGRLKDAQDAFTQRVDKMADDARGLQGFAKIQGDTQAQLAQLNREAQAANARPEDIESGRASINREESRQAADLQARNREETEQLEAQARAKSLSAERSQTGAIEEEYGQRLRKYQDELRQQEIGWEDYNRRMVAAGQLRDGELEEAATQARQKMASEFSSFFGELNHPLLALARLGDRVGGEAAASLVQQLQSHYGHGGAEPGTSGVNIFDRIAGAPHGRTGASGATPGLNSARAIAVTQAHIEVGSASIAFGGGGYAGGEFTGGASGAGAGEYSGSSAGSSGGVEYSGSRGAVGSVGSAMSQGAAGAAMAASPAARHAISSTVGDLGQGLDLWRQTGATFGTHGASVSAGASGGATATSSNSGASLSSVQSFDVSQLSQPASASSVLAEAQAAPAAHASLQPSSATGRALSDAKGAVGVGNEANSIWGSKGSTAQSGYGSSMAGGGINVSNTLGAAGGALGVFSAYEGTGGVGGALSGAMSGMQFGMALGGPVGAAVGAAGGAVMGALGFGGRSKAEDYDRKQVQPQLAQASQAYETGSMDYSSAYSAMEGLDTSAERTTKQWGPGAHSYYNDHIRTEISQARGRLDQEERAGRSNFGASAAQYDVGSDSIPRTGMAVIHQGERIIPSDQNERLTRAIESGAAARRMPAQQSSGWGGDIHVHAIDAQGVQQFLNNNKHLIRGAVNSSYAENSGGADAGF